MVVSFIPVVSGDHWITFLLPELFLLLIADLPLRPLRQTDSERDSVKHISPFPVQASFPFPGDHSGWTGRGSSTTPGSVFVSECVLHVNMYCMHYKLLWPLVSPCRRTP